MKYRVYMQTVVSYYIDVETDDEDSAADEAMTEGLPGLMFLDRRYPDEGEWEVTDVAPLEVVA